MISVNLVVSAVVARKDGWLYFFYKEIMFLLISDMILVIEVYIDINSF